MYFYFITSQKIVKLHIVDTNNNASNIYEVNSSLFS